MDYDRDDWIDSATSPGDFEKVGIVKGPPGTDQFSYHPLDLYLMGLLDPTEVGSFRYIDNPSDPDKDGIYAGTQVNLTANNVINEEGARSPAYPNTQARVPSGLHSHHQRHLEHRHPDRCHDNPRRVGALSNRNGHGLPSGDTFTGDDRRVTPALQLRFTLQPGQRGRCGR